MASDCDDVTDADFFDKLVDDDDDGGSHHRLPDDEGGLSALTLSENGDTGAPDPAAAASKQQAEAAAPPVVAEADGGAAALPEVKAVAALPKAEAAAPPDAEAEAEAEGAPAALPEVKAAAAPPKAEAEAEGAPAALPEVKAAAAPPKAEAEAEASPEGGSPGSGKAVHTAVKQVQWSVFTGSSSGADPFGDFLANGGGGEDTFLGANLTGDQGAQGSVVGTSSVGAADHSFSNGVDSNGNAQLDWGAFGVESVDQNTSTQSEWTGGAVNSDPKFLDSLYPGWKYDEATHQWYQVETFGAQGNADNSGAVPVVGSNNVQQQHQHFSVSYLQNSSQAGLETIAEEGSTTATSWGQDESSAAVTEYPPNMLFYAEYPGWYFDTITQQWHTLESYQQGVAQTATTAAASDGFSWTGQNVAHAGNSYASNYNQQSQWQQASSINSMQPENLRDNSLVSSSYGSHQHAENQIGQQANAEPLESSTNYRSGINAFVPFRTQYTGSEGHQDSFKGFEPTNYQSAYKSVELSTSHQSTSTSHQSGYKGSEPSKAHQAGHQGFKPSTNNQSYEAFVPTTGDQIGHQEFGPSIDSQASHVAHEPSTSHGYGSSNGVAKPKEFFPRASMYQMQTHADPATRMHLPNNYLGSENSMNFAEQQFIDSNALSQQFGSSPHEQRSSAGRPPHALVAFGFGGKFVVVKKTTSMTTNFDSRNQGNSCGTVSILNVSEIIADKIDQPSIPNGSALNYFHALCRQPIPGPLLGGSATAKDVNKWLDEIIGGYESSVREFQGGDAQKLLISLLKILCQHYGKLRSPFGSDPSQEGVDGPEMAVTKLFSSCKSSSAQMGEYGAIAHCMKNIPSENQIQATAQEVQNLLVSGRRKEALQYAQEGQLWGPALILALQLGDKFYADTVKKMAHCHFVSGSPLRTLCLLIAGQPADVFNVESPVDGNYGTLHRPQQPAEGTPKGMLDNWQENLSIMTANRTKGDDLVIIHLGDCLWKEKNEVAAAHSCYLVAELNIDSYSESARICLIGADHLRCPRTYTSPEAIQRTELYEYAKVLGNSQYTLLPFQPYKLIYAYMLVEIGKVSDSLRYCQASLKVLKASGRAPELEAWKQLFSSLEERIQTHQQGGYGTNLAPAKLVGKIFTSLDKSLSRMMGTQPASLPPLPHGSSNDRDIYSAPPATKAVNSQSVMAMSSLMSSASEQSMSEMAGGSGAGRKGAHNRSVSEPDFGRTPKHGTVPDNAQSTSGSGSSRFGWLLQKTIGFVSKSHHQAKLGEQNKFYYDEKLKRWVEEGAEIPAEEPPLPPPPTKASFQNGIPDYNLNAPSSGGYTANGFAGGKPSNPPELSSGMPPIPPSQNQFSARGLMGVRSRYVDTFNKGGANAFGAAAATSYSKPVPRSMNPLSGATFFVPTPAVVASEQMPGSAAHAHSETTHEDEPSPSPAMEASLASPPPPVPPQTSVQRYPSMDSIMTPSGSANSSFSRPRAASWSGTYSDQLSSSAVSRSPDGRSPLIPGERPSRSRSDRNSSARLNGLGEDLHEVEL